jgi:hypothetical protein
MTPILFLALFFFHFFLFRFTQANFNPFKYNTDLRKWSRKFQEGFRGSSPRGIGRNNKHTRTNFDSVRMITAHPNRDRSRIDRSYLMYCNANVPMLMYCSLDLFRQHIFHPWRVPERMARLVVSRLRWKCWTLVQSTCYWLRLILSPVICVILAITVYVGEHLWFFLFSLHHESVCTL